MKGKLFMLIIKRGYRYYGDDDGHNRISSKTKKEKVKA